MAWPSNLRTVAQQPPVSIVTPTYNRRRYIPALIQYIKSQTYPAERIEWLVYDDGSDRIRDLLEPHMTAMNIRYFSSDVKLNIGAKRNFLNREARGAVIVCMDDDDYYMPERVAHAVQMLLAKRVEIVGATRNHLYFCDDGSIWETGPYAPNHATFGTMAYTKKYASSHVCDETLTHAEEVAFTKDYSEPLAQLDPLKVMLVICHPENTFSKSKLREKSTPVMRKTSMKLTNFIRKAETRRLYTALAAPVATAGVE
jgi:glycosyltransferase involved in cell wall biosynthesis